MITQRSALELNVVAIVPDAATIELMSATLKGSGDRLSVATDLAEGLTRVSAQVPDVAFVDVTLGDSAGLAVLHHVRALAPNVSVFALTRADRLDLGVQGVALGGAGVLVKPISGDELLNALSDVRTRLGERLERTELLRRREVPRVARRCRTTSPRSPPPRPAARPRSAWRKSSPPRRR